MTNRHYEIQPLGDPEALPRHAGDVSGLHAALLAHSPLVMMGPEFMQEFYYSVLPAEGLISVSIAYVDDEAAGFIVCTDDASGFMSRAVKRHWLRLCVTIAKSLLRNPGRLLAMKEAYQIQSNVQAEGYGPETGELLSFGVLPRFRSRRFLKESALHIGSDLLASAVEALRAAGKTRIRAIVDKDNLEAQFFYRSQGWQVGLADVKGWSVPTMEFVREL